MKKVALILGIVIVIFIIVVVVAYFVLNNKMISEEEALKVCYDYAKVEENDVTIGSISKDYSSFEYEVKFYDDYYEYEIDVNFFNGNVNNFEKDRY